MRNQNPINETCNGIDDDCDGIVDEGAICPSADNAQVACVQGNCMISCDAGFDDCDGDPTNGCETDLMNDDFNCGTCGRRCICPPSFIPTCVDGNCGCDPI